MGSKDYLACKKIKITECNWIIKQPQKTEFKILVKLRNTSNPVKGKIKVDFETGISNLYFDEPQYGVSTGQAAVFYNTEEHTHVLGGGWITDAPNKIALINLTNA